MSGVVKTEPGAADGDGVPAAKPQCKSVSKPKPTRAVKEQPPAEPQYPVGFCIMPRVKKDEEAWV